MRRKLFLYAVILTVTVFLISEFFPDIWVPHKACEDKTVTQHEGKVISVVTKEDHLVLLIRDPEGFRVRGAYYEEISEAWRLTGKIISYRSELSFGDPARNPHCFDFRKYLRSSDIFLTGTIRSIEVKRDRKGILTEYSGFLAGIKYRFEEKLPESSRGMMMGMLFGDTDGIPDEVMEDFRKNGTAHILAVSGLHIGLLYSIYEKTTGNRTGLPGAVILGFLMYTYGTLTLWSPSVFRAEMMIGMKTVAKLKELRYDSLTAMSLAAFILIFKNPYVIYGTGFQMSFLAIISMNIISGKLPDAFPDSLSQAIAVNASMIMYQAYVFNYISPLAVLINVPVLYAAGIAIPLAFLTFSVFVVTSAFGTGFMFPLLYIPASSVTDMLVWLNSLLHLGGRTVFDVISPPVPIVAGLICILLFQCSEYSGILRLRGLRKKTAFISAVIISAAFICGIMIHEPITHDEVIFADVGQGACTHIRAGSANVLIDGGGNRERNIGKTVLKPYLLKNGVRKVDLSLATHEDMDHIRGLIELAECYKAPEPFSGALKGMKYNISDDVKIEVLWPAELRESKQGNEESSVFMIDYDGIRILVTGDLDAEGESEMVKYYKKTGEESKLKADILNVGHHGSKTSTSDLFLEVVSPSAAVIQVGRNSYGHPSDETLERLEAHGIEVYRNDKMGAVGIDIDNVNGETGIKAFHVMIG